MQNFINFYSNTLLNMELMTFFLDLGKLRNQTGKIFYIFTEMIQFRNCLYVIQWKLIDLYVSRTFCTICRK